MRILLYSDSDVFAGTERHLMELAHGLQQAGISLTLACPVPSVLADRASDLEINILPIPKRGAAIDWSATRVLRRLIRCGAADVIHVHNGRTALAAALAVRLANAGRCVMTQHFLNPAHSTRRGLKGWVSQRVHGWLNRSVDHFVAISEAVRQNMFARGDATARRVTVVPNGIALPDPATLPPAQQMRRELRVPADAPMVVCAARLEPEKRVDCLIEAMSLVRNSHPTAVCVVAGDGSCRRALEQQLSQKGLGGSCRLVGFRADVLSIIAAGDLFVLPSLAEPFGLVLLEAMALKKPVVATDAGGPREIVINGETGFLVPPSDAGSLAGAIGRLLDDPSARREMGESGYDRFCRCYTSKRMAEATAAVYRRVLSGAAAVENHGGPEGVDASCQLPRT